jgi:hypothetical protein
VKERTVFGIYLFLWSKKDYEERLVDDGIGGIDRPFLLDGRSKPEA